MRVITDIEQGSQEWLDLRLGKVTASRIKDVMTNGKGGALSKAAESYMIELVAEILTGTPKPFFENDAMRWGTANEPVAKAMFELREDIEVDEVAFIEHSEFIGMSPDGLIGSDGLIEIKCPNTSTQIKRALSGDYSSDYKAQIQMQLWVSDREYCYFLSYDPRLDCGASYLLEKVERDDKYISDMKEKTESFVEQMKAMIFKLENK